MSASTPIYVSFTPSLFYKFYNESGLIGKGLNGSTYSIGLVEECYQNIPDSTYQADLGAFDHEFGLPNTTLNFLISGGGSWQLATGRFGVPSRLVWTLSGPMSQRRALEIYVCFDTLDTPAGLASCDTLLYQQSATYNVMIVSNSWGLCGIGALGTDLYCVNGLDPYGTTMTSAASAGMNIFASVGDWVWSPFCAEAYYPASDPYAIAVGGTTVTGVGVSGSYGSERTWVSAHRLGECCILVKGLCHTEVDTLPGELLGTNGYYTAKTWQSSLLGNRNRYFPDVSMVGNGSTGVPIVWDGNW